MREHLLVSATHALGGVAVVDYVGEAVRYTEDHEAVKFDDSTGTGTVYITDYAQSSLGDVVFVELPTEGTEVSKGGKSQLSRSHQTRAH